MTVRELKDLLEDFEDECEVRFASQPGWAFEYEIDDAVSPDAREVDDDGEPAEAGDEAVPVVYLVEGRQIGYLPGFVADSIGWGR